MSTLIGTLVVPFGESVSGAGGGIVAEWDDTMNVTFSGKVLNTYISGGVRYFVVVDGSTLRVISATDIKSQFIPGDSAYLLTHVADDSIEITDVRATYGTIKKNTGDILARTENISFAEAGGAIDLQYRPYRYPAFEWFGNEGRDIEVSDRRVTVLSGDFPCLAMVSYKVQFQRYRLQTPTLTLEKEDTVPILVYIYYKKTVDD